MPVVNRPLYDSIQDTNLVIVSGKGGVGKSTMAGALSYGQSEIRNRNTNLIDLDAAHSSFDTLGLPTEETDRAELFNEIREVTDRLKVLLMSPLVRDPKDIDDLNQQLELYVPDQGVLPILRLAVHSRFFGIPSEHKPMSHVLQLMEILQNRTHFISDYREGTQGVSVQSLDIPDMTIIDSENTQGLMTVISSLQYLERSLINVRDRMQGNPLNPSNFGFQATIGRQPNIRRYAESSVGKNPEPTIDLMRQFCERMYDTRTGIVLVTNPGRNEVNQTTREAQHLLERGMHIDHVLMNRWPTDTHKIQGAEKWEHAMRDRLSALQSQRNIGFSRVSPDDPLEDIDPQSSTLQEECFRNLERIEKTFSQVTE
ncbi:hypothetical protein COU78_06495 [Candidatus Peregrinibacteria bacterium CG10_big_fil_rev_8_21_14_0_10_49_24]|nr:MAG: hypothetical protein COV83_00185 [Candidatus Peregrinibacteria bacterium CG11_big_fil_rev_8_21_14_0_20_49_14]PIR50499.1 MAG: hypothetical protein COU78_06495 [Candidatus Peregrinibacteria bacterium CG10_big_fil_rev_8_21_14_0_10_49_24]PJA67693.1 MAG: hypothetical protein CO157_03215 [Candidatus Peregrinibacteria bacterium CG_4_9_14_3_um_filter_49_12]